MQMEIRQATERDAAQLAALADEIWREHYPPIIGLGQVEYMLGKFQSADRIAEDMMANGYTYYLADLGGKHAGYCAVKPENDGTLILSKLYVQKSARGKGVARAFVETIGDLYRERYDKIRLTVNKYNTGSIAAYTRLGFVVTDSIIADIGGGYLMDDFVMVVQMRHGVTR